jgi:uridine phosphorylase
LKKTIKKSALLLNDDNSIYHLNLRPGELAETIILVGDPDRVPRVSQHFDHIAVKKSKREFVTHTGTLKGRPISVVSTGIGASNIDIVINECDALHNIDFKHHAVKKDIVSLRFLRLGTCGSLIESLEVDQLVLSSAAIGFDGFMSFYLQHYDAAMSSLLQTVKHHFRAMPAFNTAYVGQANQALSGLFEGYVNQGVTLTCSGFYGPQSRRLRAALATEDLFKLTETFSCDEGSLVNVEMETAAIYALSQVLQHQACSISVVLDNVKTDSVSADIQKAVDAMIVTVLDKL